MMKKRLINRRGMNILVLAILFYSLIFSVFAATWPVFGRDQLLGYYPLNETAGNIAYNVIDSTNNLDSEGTALRLVGGGFYINSSTSHVANKTANFALPGNFTFLITYSPRLPVNLPSTLFRYDTYSYEYFGKNMTDGFNIQLGPNAQAGVGFNLPTNTSINEILVPHGGFNQNTTSVFVYNTQNVSGYKDLLFYNSVAFTGTSNVTGIRNFSIGHASGYAATIPVYKVAIWNRTLSSSEVAFLGVQDYSEAYNSTTITSSTETFSIVINYSSSYFSSISANFYYNQTGYIGTKSGSGDSVTFTKSITIPDAGAGTKVPFFWSVSLTNSLGTYSLNFSSNNQTISPNLFMLCNSTLFVPAVNFSIVNETDPTQRVNSTFIAQFSYSIGNTSSKTNISYSLPLNDTFKFCIDPNASYNVLSSIKLTADGFFDKIYDLNEVYNNLVTEKKLYMLSSGIGRSVVVELKNPNLQPLASYTVKIYRYYPDTGQYLEIDSKKTDYYGQFVTALVESTVKYRFDIYDENNILKKTISPFSYVACRTTPCILQFLVEGAITDFDELRNMTDYTYSLTFDNSTNIFTFSWNDNSNQDNILHRLYVERYLFNGTSVVCNSSSTALIGSLTCNVGSQRASYQAQAYRSSDVVSERRIGVLSVKVGDTSGTFGLEGLFWSFILLMTSLALGYWYPPVGAIMFLAGFVALGLFGIIFVNPAVYIAIAVICITFAWAFRG